LRFFAEVTMEKAVFLRNVCRLLVTAEIVPSSPILATLMTEALRSSETSVLARAKRRHTSRKTTFFIPYVIFPTVNVYFNKSCLRAVGIGTGYVICNPGIGVRILLVSRIFLYTNRQDRLWVPTSLRSIGYRVPSSGFGTSS
jgi:hypothetical protein